MSAGILRSVRVRLTLWYVLLLALILAAFSAGVYLALRQRLNETLDDSIDNRITVLLSAIEYSDGRPVLNLSPDEPEEAEHFTRVFDVDGDVTFDDIPGDDGTPVDEGALGAALDGRRTTRTVTVAGQSMRTRTAPIVRDGSIAGVLEAGLADDDVKETLSTLLIIIAVAYPLTLGVASLGGVFLAGRALGPIDRITQAARRISAEDLSQRLDLPLPDDEIGRLARTFDDMIARLEEGFRRQRQFTADASHELRTPLTAIKGQVEVALTQSRDPAAYQEVLRAVNEQVDRMTRLVGSLLTLARADAGEAPISRERVDLAGLAATVAEQVAPAAEAKGPRISVADGPPLQLLADEDLLIQLLLNLLDNAVKHTGPGGEVHLEWGARDGVAEVSVRDTGSGIAPEHLPHLFERFYRVDAARSRADGGAGLGLSICRWIAEAHGGSISVESTPGRGSTFTVRLPLAPYQ
jgi:heavy metal sensor kinase